MDLLTEQEVFEIMNPEGVIAYEVQKWVNSIQKDTRGPAELVSRVLVKYQGDDRMLLYGLMFSSVLHLLNNKDHLKIKRESLTEH